MLSPLQNFFHYSRSERRGTFILLVIIALLLLTYFVRDFFKVSDEVPLDVKEFNERITSFEQTKKEEVFFDSVELFMFDPNLIGVEEWVLLGFSEKQAQSIENYKGSGAVFKIKKDLLKLFMVDEFKYAQLEPYIDLPEDYPKYEYSEKTNEEYEYAPTVYAVIIEESETPIYDGFDEYDNVHYTKINGVYQYLLMPYETESVAEEQLIDLDISEGKIVQLNSTKGYYPISKKNDIQDKVSFNGKLSIDINLADTTELKQLYGIGSGYAKRIVNYRESLGGYVSLDQLNEVYGLKQETIDKILSEIYIGNSDIEKIDVNTATIDELKAHPYIKWNVANSIVQIRNNYGKFASVDGIAKSVLVDDALFQKLKPYLEAK